MNKTDIVNLMVLGRDRIYITLEQIQKAIELTHKEGLTDVVEMLMLKEDEVKRYKDGQRGLLTNLRTGGE